MATVTFSDIMDELIDGDDPFGGADNGNIDENPLFLDGQPSGNWTIAATYDPATGQTKFTDGGAMWTVDEHKDKTLNPDTTQFLQSLIVSNTPTEIVVWGDFRELGDNNETYQINDYHLQPTSPCIDHADNNKVPDDVADLNNNGDTIEPMPMDLDLLRRFVNDPVAENLGNDSPEYPNIWVDMGAYEFNPCPWDFSGDAKVGAFDLALVLGEWGTSMCPPYPDADSDLDCNVDAADLAEFLINWGPCP